MNQSVEGKGGANNTEEGRLLGNSKTMSNINILIEIIFIAFESQVLKIHSCAQTLSDKQVSHSPCKHIEMKKVNKFLN